MEIGEAANLVGCCGLYCGLCSKYQSHAASRCMGCRLGEQHSWCSIWNCCAGKRRFETCAECQEMFRCDIHLRRRVAEWIPAAESLRQIKEAGPQDWLGEQRERQALLEALLESYNDGRSMSFYCRVCARVGIGLINKAIQDTEMRLRREGVDELDTKSIARTLRAVIKDLTLEANVDLSKP